MSLPRRPAKLAAMPPTVEAALREAGMEESALGVDSANPHDAARLYGDCGFRVVQRNAVYRKPVDLRTGGA